MEALAPLLTRTDIAWFSLQKGGAADQVKPGMINLAPSLIDFAETAAALAHLDMVITVDTSVAHLAGAMGKPTWVLLPFAPGLAMAARTSGQPLVPDPASVPSIKTWGLGERDRADQS